MNRPGMIGHAPATELPDNLLYDHDVDATVHFLMDAMQRRCLTTHNHMQRVSLYAASIARLMGFSPARTEELRVGALLHDIGKLFTPDAVLHKPGPLTADEFMLIKQHPEQGADWLENLPWKVTFTDSVRFHHERWDGRGYPYSRRSYDIPQTARIVSVIDAYDALREPRPYRAGLTSAEASKVILDSKGTWYDPVVVDLFLTFLAEFETEMSVHLSAFPVRHTELSAAAQLTAPHAGLAQDQHESGSQQ